jgi:DedD protein
MMERRAKERLIGASILVVLIVLVVPELLSGPKPVPPAPQAQQLPAPASNAEPVRNVTVDLTTNKAPALPEPELASAPPASTSSASGPAPNQAVSQPPPEPVREAPRASPAPTAPPAATMAAPVESSAPSPISKPGTAHGEVLRSPGWTVQLGSFASRANADNLVHHLKAQGFAVYVLSGGSGAAMRHRVRVGPLNDRESAEHTAARLKALGHASTLVPPGT